MAEPVGARRERRVEDLRADGFVVSAQTPDGEEAVRLARYYRPDLLLVSSRVDGRLDALAVVGAVHAAAPEVGIVVALDGGEDLALAPPLFRAGTRGIVDADAPHERLRAGLAAVLAGHGIVPTEVLDLRPLAGHGFRPIAGPLSNREWEIVDLLIAGATTHEIANRLVLTEATVRSHLKHMYRKLDVHSRAELVEAARRLFAAPPAVNPRRR